MKYNIIIAGGRDFNNYDLLYETCVPIITDVLKSDKDMTKENIIIFSGMAKGADSLGYRFAYETQLKCKQFLAEWEKYDKGAGYIRNKRMAEEADMLIAFWDGYSKGTKDMIYIMKKLNKTVFIKEY